MIRRPLLNEIYVIEGENKHLRILRLHKDPGNRMSAAELIVKGNQPLPAVVCMTWNDQSDLLAVGTPTGFIVYDTSGLGHAGPSRAEATSSSCIGMIELANRRVHGGVRMVALHGNSSMICFSGCTPEMRNTITLWDDDLCLQSCESGSVMETYLRAEDHLANTAATHRQSSEPGVLAQMELGSPPRAIRCHHECVIVAEVNVIHLFGQNLEPLKRYSTADVNFCNTVAMAYDVTPTRAAGTEGRVLKIVIPGDSIGEVHCIHFRCFPSLNDPHPISVLNVSPKPHESSVRCIAISKRGNRAMTISTRGTSLKLIDTDSGKVLQQFSRGAEPTVVSSIAINNDETLAACISENGTIHVYDIAAYGQGDSVFRGSFAPVADSSWKVARRLANYASSVGHVLTYSIFPADREAGHADAGAFANYVDEHYSEDSHIDPTFAALAFEFSKSEDKRSRGAVQLYAAVGTTAPAETMLKAKCLRILIRKRGCECDATPMGTFYFPKEIL
jgi:hypothetical protein